MQNGIACQRPPALRTEAGSRLAQHPSSRHHPAPEPVGAERHTPIILTESINYPPELAYRTPYRFVGGPYHRGIGDIADMTDAAMGPTTTAVHSNRRAPSGRLLS